MRPVDDIRQPRPIEPRKPAEPIKKLEQPAAQSTASKVKAFEQDFAAAYKALKLNFWGMPKPSTPPSTPLTSSGSDTAATYKVGAPSRPDIHHDNGFLQNPNDPNDPNPMIPTISPSTSDRVFYAEEKAKADGAQVLEHAHIPFGADDEARRLEDGIDAYRHYLEGNGADRTFSYDEFISEDKYGQRTLDNAIGDTQRGAEDLYNQMVAKDPSLAGKTVIFDVTGDAISVSSFDENSLFHYPDTENWKKAIGGHSIWNSATVTVAPPTEPGGKPQFSMNYTLHAEDRYNFNPDQHDIDTGAPDAIRGEQLEKTELAHQYMNYGTAERDVSWSPGGSSVTTSPDKPSEGRR